MQNFSTRFAFHANLLIEHVHLLLPQNDPRRGVLAATVGREFPSVHLSFDRDGVPGPLLRATQWESPHFDWWEFDGSIDDGEALHLVDDANRGATFLVEVLNRCQRAFARRNAHSQCAAFARALRVHREHHDLAKPLVLTDYRHALDVWQWTLRLDAHASLALQLAALFHDVERLVSEADERKEQHAKDYQAFKDAHARNGAQMTRALLRDAGMRDEVAERVAQLIALHEHRANDDVDAATLNDADALSFFSLNSSGYADYFGPEQTRRKVAWTWNRMRDDARARLHSIRLRGDVASLLDDVKEAG